MEKQKDEFVRMRDLLSRRHVATIRKIKSLSSRVIQLGMDEDKAEMLKKTGEKEGLCYALKVLDKVCQTEMQI